MSCENVKKLAIKYFEETFKVKPDFLGIGPGRVNLIGYDIFFLLTCRFQYKVLEFWTSEINTHRVLYLILLIFFVPDRDHVDYNDGFVMPMVRLEPTPI